ncbi:uncharacterized protein LOC118743680 [Rhagoletis pomonella]|uniref:uncharacterized protein LOC118743680 n=1 Tax=Rhagoletis pomonella TaxID=28610 RepID=UPI00177B0BBC|nr:uncharacterized protein LOC118743680 [Rhagoletis pomonella]
MILTKYDLHAFKEGECDTIILRNSDLKQSDVNIIAKKFSRLAYLDLSDNGEIDSVKLIDPVTLYLRNCTIMRDIYCPYGRRYLKTLDIAGCSINLEEHLIKRAYPRLENLTLSWKPRIKWHSVLRKLGRLRRLTIESVCTHTHNRICPRLCRQGWTSFVIALMMSEKIKTINFGGRLGDENFAKLKMLPDRELGFRIWNGAANCLSNLYTLENLYTLYLEHTHNVTNADLLELITNCPNLRKITLDHCDGVSNDFLFRAAEFLKERDKDEPLKPRLNLELCGCDNITENIREDPQYARAESAMSLILFFDCKHPTSDYRNDLIIPYPAPNVQLSIYILFEIFGRLERPLHMQPFASVCIDFENVAIEEERHLKIVQFFKAKIVDNNMYDTYLQIIAEDKNFFENRQPPIAMQLKLKCKVVELETIFDDFPKIERVQLLHCVIDENKLPKNKEISSVKNLEIVDANPLYLWTKLVEYFPNINEIKLKIASLNEVLSTNLLNEEPKLKGVTALDNITRLTISVGIKDDYVKLLADLPNLKIFSVQDNDQITGKYISELNRVEELQLYLCENLNKYYLSDILSCLALKSLDIRKCFYTSEEHLSSVHLTNEMYLNCETLSKIKVDWQNEETIMLIQIISTLVDLEVSDFMYSTISSDQTDFAERFFMTLAQRTNIKKLTLETGVLIRHLNYLALLQHLTHLRVRYSRNFVVTQNFYETIGKLVNLEYLYLENCEGLLHIVEKCTNLKEVRLIKIDDFSTTFIRDLVKVLRQARTKEQLPLKLYILNKNKLPAFMYSELKGDYSQETIVLGQEYGFDERSTESNDADGIADIKDYIQIVNVKFEGDRANSSFDYEEFMDEMTTFD